MDKNAYELMQELIYTKEVMDEIDTALCSENSHIYGEMREICKSHIELLVEELKRR